jgi:tetratricopeptide (TPR) repeat protein
MSIKVFEMTIKRSFFLPLLMIAVCVSFVFSAAPDSKIVADGNRCVDLVFQEKFSDAHNIANNMIRQFPESPVGYFLRAAVYHYQMIYLRKNIYEKQLYEACSRGIQIGEQHKNKNEWNAFFLAATIGVQGNFDRVNGRLVSSLKLATRSMEIFREMNEEEVIDILYGTGVYEYWIGANIKLLWWLPNARDNRPRALENLNRIRREGVFTRQIVLYDLMEMYLNEKNNQQVINIANEVLKKYPNNSIALWALYDAYDAIKNIDERNAVGNKIAERINMERDNMEQQKFFNRRTRRNADVSL